MKGVFILFSLVLLSGCATPKKEIQYVDRPVEVFVAVPKPCLGQKEIPPQPSFYLNKEGAGESLTSALKAARADNVEAKAFALAVGELLRLCAQ